MDYQLIEFKNSIPLYGEQLRSVRLYLFEVRIEFQQKTSDFRKSTTIRRA